MWSGRGGRRAVQSLAGGLKAFGGLLLEAAKEWIRDRCHGMGAALAFYAVLSAGPFVMLVLALSSVLFGLEATEARILPLMKASLGPRGTALLRYLILTLRGADASHDALGVFVLALGATGFFQQLRDSLSTIWDVRREDLGLKHQLWKRLAELAFTLFFAAVTLASVIAGALLAAMTRRPAAERLLPGGAVLWYGGEIVFFFALLAGVVMVLFKVMPEVPTTWRGVLPGAVFTVAVYKAGEVLADHYLARYGIVASDDVAILILALLLWFYFISQIFLFGAEFTRLYHQRHSAARGQALPPRPGRSSPAR